jgi:outer membrane protein assembly factor BamD
MLNQISWASKAIRLASSVLLVSALSLTLGLSGCSSPPKEKGLAEGSAERMLADAKAEMADGRWQEAIKQFEALEAKYPFGSFAQQAQLEVAYAQYKNNEPAQALAAIERYLRLYPNSRSIDYALYLKGLVNFNEDSGFMARFGGQDLSERDSKAARESFDAFRDLITRFPESKYAADASARMRYLLNSLAMGEIHVARYYMKKHAFVAAANRAQIVVKNFQETPAVEDALGILVEAYTALHLDTQRNDAQRVLRQNFPNSRHLRAAQ